MVIGGLDASWSSLDGLFEAVPAGLSANGGLRRGGGHGVIGNGFFDSNISSAIAAVRVTMLTCSLSF